MERVFEELPVLTSPMTEFSLSECVARSNRERPKRRRGFPGEIMPALTSPPVKLLPNAGSLYLHLSDALIASVQEALETKDTTTADEVLEALAKRQFYDTLTQAFVTPSSLTAGHLEFLIANDPSVKLLFEIEAETIRRRIGYRPNNE
jgi:hypothetical protein